MRETKMMQWIIYQYIKVRTSDLIGLIIDIGLKGETLDKPQGNYGQIL